MAEARAVINVDINTSDAAAGLRSLQSQLSAFNSTLTKSSAVQSNAIRNAKDNLLELVNASRFFSAETVRMQTAAAALDKTLSKGQVTLGQFFSAKFRKDSLAAAQVLSLAETRAAALQTQFVATGAAANGMREAIAIRPLQAFNNAAVVSAQKLAIQRAMLNQATTSMINFGKNTQWAGRQLMVGFTVPLTIFAAASGKAFRDLEKEAVNFKKVYGDAFTPPAEMEANLQAVQELGKEFTKYGIAVKDTVALAAQAAAAGAQNKDLIDATTQSTRLATLGQMEQNQALETTISLQNAFKLSGDELSKSINFLNMVENQTVVTLQDLSAAIPRVAPVIKGLGGDVQDLAAFLAAMQEGGVTAEQGANALKSGLASLINPTNKAKEALQGMGISLDSIIQMNRGDLMGTVQSFADALDTLDTFTRQQALEKVFGKFQYARLGALFDNINKDGTQAARVLEIAGLSAAEMAASAEKELTAIEESVGTKFTAAMERIQLAIAPIGEMFTKMAIPVINFFGDLLEKFNNLPDFAKKFIGLGTVITGIVIPAGTMFLGLLMNLVGTLIKFGSTTGAAFKGFITGGFKGAFDAVSQSTRYMSLAEIDAANAAQQLAGTTSAVNAALLQQVPASESAQAAVMELAYAYEILTQQMREAAIQNEMVFGLGAGAMGAAGARGPRVRRNRGGTIPGSGNTDTVPAMLTPGEFVVNKQATQDNLGLLRQINSGGKVPGYFGGGIISGILRGMLSRRSTMPTNIIPATGVISRGNAAQQAIAAQQARRLTGQPYSQTAASAGQYEGAYAQAHMTERQKVTLPSPFNPNSQAADDWLLAKIPGTTKKARAARELARKGLIGSSLSNDTVSMPRIINDAARTGSTQPLTLTQAADILELSGAVKIGPNSAMALAGFPIGNNDQLGRGIAAELRRIAAINGDIQLTDPVLTAARNSAIGNTRLSSVRSATTYPYAGVMQSTELQDYLGINSLVDLQAANAALRAKGHSGIRLIEKSRPSGKVRIELVDKSGNTIIEEVSSQDKIKFNKGNIVPGQGNKDTVPAMLTPGEFVVNKKATQSNMALLHAINNGKVKGYAAGDLVEGANAITRKPVYFVENPDGTQTEFTNKRSATRASKQFSSPGRPRLGGGLAGGASMLGMTAMMGGMMIPGVAESPGLSAAVSGGGMALSMAPMLAGLGAAALPIAGIAAAATAAGVALYKWRDNVDSSAKQAADFGANLGGTANALNNVATILGQQTPAQRQAQLQLGISEQDIKKLSESTQFQNIFTSEEGQKFISDLENATSAERFKKLSDYLTYAVAAGLMDPAMAESFAKGISAQIGDAILGTQVSTAIRGTEQGPGALIELGEKRISEASNAIANVIENNSASYQDSSKAIGAATQIIQDFSNAEALAREQFAAGTITYEELQSVVQKSRDVQNEYTNAIEQAMIKTSDFGGTMQAVKDQLINAGLVTEQGFADIEKAATKTVQTQRTGRLAVRDKNLLSAAQSALASGMSEANVLNITEEISKGIGPVFDIYQKSISQGLSGIAAFETAAGAAEIAKMVQAPTLAGVPGGGTGMVQNIVLDFAASGGDVTALTSLIASLPQDGEARYDFMMNFRGLDPEQQTKMIADFQKISSILGTEFANTFQASPEYQNALKNGTEDLLIANVEQAANVFGDNAEKIIEYANNTGKSLAELTKYGADIASMPQEMQFRLGIEQGDIADLEKFGPIAQSMAENWSILQKLNKNINMKLYTEFLSVDENGNPIDPMIAAQRVKELNKLWKDFEGAKTLEARKTAYLELYTLQNGAPVDKASYDQMWNDLVQEFGQQRITDLPADRLNKIFEINAEIKGAETAIEALRGMSAAAYAMGDVAKGSEYAARMQTLQSSIKGLKAERVSTVMFGPKIDRGNTGGGGGEKSIAQQLKESADLSTGFAKAFGKKDIKTYLAKPFGPEFLQYLKSQGQKGLDLLKGNFKQLNQAYMDYEKDQKNQSLMALQFMPGELKKQLDVQKATLNLTERISKQYGVQGDIAAEIVSQFDDKQKLELQTLLSSGKINTSTSETAQKYRETVAASTELAQWNSKNAQLLEYMSMSAEDLQQAQRDNAIEINDLQRQLAEINIIQPLQDQVEVQQKIIDGISRSIELKQREADAISRNIELKQRELEPIDDQINAYEKQIETINDSYDAQLEALDKIYKKEEDLAALREGKADVASALARGDIASAAQAALQLQRTMATTRQENARNAIEQARQQEIQSVEANINNLKEQRKIIEDEISKLQDDQRIKQDEIYNLQLSQIPVQDEIYRLEQLITQEADKLDDQYNSAALEAENLRSRLEAAKNEALALASALSGLASAQNDLNTAKAAAAWTPAGGGQIYGQGPQNIMYGGPIKKYAMGGMINYKGSTEKAPGFMMGGKIKKYATGSFVPGTGMTDKIPAMLTPGEFVVRKSVAQQYAPLLENLNGQIYPKLGSTGASRLNFSAPSFSGGAGFSASDIKFNVPPNINSFMYPQSTTVGTETDIRTNTTNYVSGPTTVQYNYNLNVSAGSNASADDIANTIMYKIKRIEDRNIKGTQVG